MGAAVEILAPTGPDKLKKAFSGVKHTRVVREPTKSERDRLVVAFLSDLDVAKRRRELVSFVDGLEARGEMTFVLVSAKTTKPRSYQTLETLARWGSLRGFYLAPDLDAVRRMVRARLAGAENVLMASVMIEDDKLVVWSCEPKRYEVPVSEIPVLAEMTTRTLQSFVLNASGSRVSWPKLDVDLGLDAIRYHADPTARKAQDKARREEATKYVGAIKTLRQEMGLRQSSIPGLTERQVRRVEHGESMPRSDTLKKLAAAHGMTIDVYLDELSKRSS